MKCHILLLAVHCCLALVLAASLPERDALTRAAARAASLARKILNDDACVKTDLTSDLSGDAHSLEYFLSDVRIPAAPVMSQDQSLEESLRHVLEGLHLHQELVEKLSDVLGSGDTLKVLLADIRDLSAQVQQMQELAEVPITSFQRNLPDLFAHLGSDYKAQVAAHLSLQQLRRFMQDVFRSLRHIAVSR